MRTFLVALSLPCVLLAQDAPAPPWTRSLPRQPGRMYAVGIAPLAGSQAQALKQAIQNARVELVIQLRASVQADATMKSTFTSHAESGGPSSATSKRQVVQDSRVSSQANDLPGLTVTETWVDFPNRAVYALAFLDLMKAVNDLQARLEDVRRDNGQPVALDAPLVDRARAIRRLKKGRDELARLEVLMDPLVASPTGPMLRSDLHEARKSFEKDLTDLRASMALSLRGDGTALPNDLATAIRTAALKQGLGWNEALSGAPRSGSDLNELTVLVRMASPAPATGGWWEIVPAAPFTEAKAALEVTMLSRNGGRYAGSVLVLDGVGNGAAAAGQGILIDCQRKFETLFDKWLSDLAL